ncbi:hypothetical protein DFH06DRAFT_1128019 [Mycena polygramma]|nr:hypothetical protein DFH06DRAFT_1128019 [Mycena polygramma]
MTPRVAEHSEDLGTAESADSTGLIGIGRGIVGDGTEGQRTIRTNRTCGSWKAGKCREHGGNLEGEGVSEDERDTEVKPEEDRRDRRTTNEEGEDVERGRMRTEAAESGRNIGSGETRKVNRDNRKRRKPKRRCAGQRLTLRHMAVREAEAFRSGRRAGVLGKIGNGRVHGHMEENSLRRVLQGLSGEGRRNENSGPSWDQNQEPEQERCRMGYREGIREAEGEPDVPSGKQRMERGEDGKPSTSSGSDSGPRPVKPKPERELGNCHIVEFGLGSETAQAGTRRKEGMWKESEVLNQSSTKTSEPNPKEVLWCITDRDSIKTEGDSAEGQDRRWRTQIGEWNEKSRSLMDQCSISESRRFGVGVAATSERGRDVQLGRKMLAESNGLETQRLMEGKRNAKWSKVGSEVGSGEIREEVGQGNGGIRDERVGNKQEVGVSERDGGSGQGKWGIGIMRRAETSERCTERTRWAGQLGGRVRRVRRPQTVTRQAEGLGPKSQKSGDVSRIGNPVQRVSSDVMIHSFHFFNHRQ